MNHKKTEKPMNHSASKDHFEPFIVTPKGGKARRCQCFKKDGSGEQCGSPARRGFNSCWRCGAGSKKRVATGKRKPAGRPPTSGLYAIKAYERTLENLETLQELEGEQRGLIREATISRQALKNMLVLEAPIKQIEHVVTQILEVGHEDPYLVQELGRQLAHFKRFNEHVQDGVDKIAKIEVAIANIDNKSAQTKMLKEAGDLFSVMKLVVTEYLDADQYEALVKEMGSRLIEKGWMLPTVDDTRIEA